MDYKEAFTHLKTLIDSNDLPEYEPARDFAAELENEVSKPTLKQEVELTKSEGKKADDEEETNAFEAVMNKYK